MSADQRGLLNVLKRELDFIENGGYRRHSWRPLYVFEDSPTCLNYGNPGQQRPCSDCLLRELVSPENREVGTPCRHIRLNDEGQTLENLYRTASQEDMEGYVCRWLKVTIHNLETVQLEKGDSRKSIVVGRTEAKSASG
jgi:hypothetical protein